MNDTSGWTRAATDGCTAPGCGTQNTVTLDGINGRRCIVHAPPGAAHLLGSYDRATAMRQVDAGNAHTAFAWLRAHLHRAAT